MKNRPMPQVDDDDTYFGGRPLPRGGVSTHGSIIATVIPLLALAGLAGFFFDLWRTVLANASQAGWLRQGLWSVWLVLQWFALFGAGFYLTLAAGMRFETGRMRAHLSGEARRAMLVLTLRSWAGPTVRTASRRYLLTGLAAIVASWGLSSGRPLAVLAFVGAVQIWAVIRITTPPVAVFLGTSDAADIEWHWTLFHIAKPLRVVSCLDVENAETPAKTVELTLDCLRSTSDSRWWELVQVLLRLTPLVVIDGTVVTPALKNELRSLLDSGQAFKCIVLCGPEGERDLLDAAEVPRGSLCAVSANAVLPLVTEIFARGEFPSPHRPVGSIAAEINHWFPAFMERAET